MAEDHALLLGQILGRLGGIEGRLDKIDKRLDDGDKRFEEIATVKAGADGERRVAMKVGSAVLTAAVTVGGGFLAALWAHAPVIASWLFPPKH